MTSRERKRLPWGYGVAAALGLPFLVWVGLGLFHEEARLPRKKNQDPAPVVLETTPEAPAAQRIVPPRKVAVADYPLVRRVDYDPATGPQNGVFAGGGPMFDIIVAPKEPGAYEIILYGSGNACTNPSDPSATPWPVVSLTSGSRVLGNAIVAGEKTGEFAFPPLDLGETPVSLSLAFVNDFCIDPCKTCDRNVVIDAIEVRLADEAGTERVAEAAPSPKTALPLNPDEVTSATVRTSIADRRAHVSGPNLISQDKLLLRRPAQVSFHPKPGPGFSLALLMEPTQQPCILLEVSVGDDPPVLFDTNARSVALLSGRTHFSDEAPLIVHLDRVLKSADCQSDDIPPIAVTGLLQVPRPMELPATLAGSDRRVRVVGGQRRAPEEASWSIPHKVTGRIEVKGLPPNTWVRGRLTVTAQEKPVLLGVGPSPENLASIAVAVNGRVNLPNPFLTDADGLLRIALRRETETDSSFEAIEIEAADAPEPSAKPKAAD